MRRRALLAVLALLFVRLTPLAAEEWVEYMSVEADVGVPTVIDVGDHVIEVGGDSEVVIGQEGTRFTILMPDTGLRHLLVQRSGWGVVDVQVTGRNVLSPDTAPRSPRPALIEPLDTAGLLPPVPQAITPPVAAVPARTAPPILAPPPPHVFLTPPWHRETTPVRLSTPPADTRPKPAVNGPTVAEQPVPLAHQQPVDTTIGDVEIKPAEQVIFDLGEDLLSRGLFGEAILQYQRLLSTFPRTRLRERATVRIAQAYMRRAEREEEERARFTALKQKDAADEARDSAVDDFTAAVHFFQEALRRYPRSPAAGRYQLDAARSLHGIERLQYEPGEKAEDSPAVVAAYLKVYIPVRDPALIPWARLGIARHYRDLGDARMNSRTDRMAIREAYDRAIAEYGKVIAAQPPSPAAAAAYFDLGSLFDGNLEMRDFSAAVLNYEELVKRFPDDPNAVRARERALWIRDNYLTYLER